MLVYLLSILKLLLFYLQTNVNFKFGLVLAMDLVVVSLVYMLFFKNTKAIKICNFTLYAIFSFIIFADVVYYSYFNRMPVISELSHAGNLSGVTDAVGGLINIKNLFFILDLPITAYVYFKGCTDEFFEKLLEKFKIKLSTFPIIVSAVSILVITFSNKYLPSASRMALFSYHIRDAVETFAKKDNSSDELDFDESVATKSEEYHNDLTGIAEGKNLIQIQVESLNNFVINAEYNGMEITPNLNKLMAENSSIYCENYIEMLGAGNTSDAEFVSLNSLYPTMRAQSYEAYVDNYLYPLPKIFKDKGYSTLAFHGYKRDFWMRDRMYPNLGIDKFYAEDSFNLDKTIGMGLADDSFFKQSFDILKSEKEPFYSFLITLTSHVPYEMPEYDGELVAIAGKKNTFFFKYLNAIHYMDKALGDFLDNLKETGLYDRSVIAIYGDHHGITGSQKEAIEDASAFIGRNFDIDSLMNVPLIIHVPGLQENKAVHSVRSELDFAPTILNLYGIDRSEFVMMGKDIFDQTHPNAAFPEGYVRKGSFISDKFVFHVLRDGQFENGVLTDRLTGEKLPLNEEAESFYRQAIREITTSNKILDTDSIKALMNKSEEKNFVNDYEKASDALVVSTFEELNLGIDAGYKYFSTDLYKTIDGYYVDNIDASKNYFRDIKGDNISLGDILGVYKEYKFIVNTENPLQFSEYLKTISGNHDSVIVKVDDKSTFETIVYKKNGYNILLRADDIPNDELESIKAGQPDLLILNGNSDNFKDQTYRDDGEIKKGELKFVDFKEVANKKRSKVNLPKIYAELASTTDELLNTETDEFIPVEVFYDLDSEAVTYAIDGEQKDIAELIDILKENPKLKIAVRSRGYHVEIMRHILSLDPPKERIAVELITTAQVEFVRKMGFTNLVFDLDVDENELFELEQLYLY